LQNTFVIIIESYIYQENNCVEHNRHNNASLHSKICIFFSLNSLWRLALALVQIAGTVWITAAWIRRIAGDERYMTLAAGEWPGLFREFLFPLTIRLALFSLLVAAGDLLFQRWKFERDLRMTPEEVRREQREEERKSPPRR